MRALPNTSGRRHPARMPLAACIGGYGTAHGLDTKVGRRRHCRREVRRSRDKWSFVQSQNGPLFVDGKKQWKPVSRQFISKSAKMQWGGGKQGSRELLYCTLYKVL